MGKPAVAIELTAEERAELEGLANRRRTAQGLARRARIVLAAAAGMENQIIAEVVGADQNTVGKWRNGVDASPSDGSTGFTTSPAAVLHGKSAMMKLPRPSG